MWLFSLSAYFITSILWRCSATFYPPLFLLSIYLYIICLSSKMIVHCLIASINRSRGLKRQNDICGDWSLTDNIGGWYRRPSAISVAVISASTKRTHSVTAAVICSSEQHRGRPQHSATPSLNCHMLIILLLVLLANFSRESVYIHAGSGSEHCTYFRVTRRHNILLPPPPLPPFYLTRRRKATDTPTTLLHYYIVAVIVRKQRPVA